MVRLVLVLLMGWPVVAASQDVPGQRLWVLWDNPAQSLRVCGDAPCPDSARYRSHFIEKIGSNEAQALFDTLQPLAEQRGMANIAHDQLPHCAETAGEPPNWVDVQGQEPEKDKAETLRGLPGVFADFRGAYGPPGYRGVFGDDVQKLANVIFQTAGIRILTKDEAAATPGHPRLSIRYSSEMRGCRPWSVSLSFKQTVVLTRDFDVILDSTTWSTSSRQDENNVEFAEVDAVAQALTAFAEAWNSVNGPDAPPPARLAKR